MNKDSDFEKVDLSYSEVPWFRRRWFSILSIFVFTPAALVVCLTGDVYAKKDDGVYRLGAKRRYGIAAIAAFLIAVGVFRIVI